MPASVFHVLTATTPDDPAYEINPSEWNSAHAVSLSLSGTDVVGAFSNANGISFGTNPSGYVTASHNALTSQTNQTVASGGIAGTTTGFTGTNASASITLNSLGLALALSAAAAGGGGIAAAAGTQTATSGTVVWANSNGLTFGMSGSSQITASHNGLTSQSNQAFSASGGSSAFQTLNFANSNGLTFTNTNGSVAASYTVPTVTQYFSATNTTFNGTNASGSITNNTNGLRVDVSVAAPAGTLSVYAQSNTTQSSSGTIPGSSLQFQGAGVASVGVSNGSVVISVPSGGGAGDGGNVLAAGTQTATTLGTVAFADSNGLSFGMSGSTRITASYTVPSTAGLLSAFNLSAGTTSNNGSAFVFSNSNGISFGLNGSTVTGSHNGLTSQSNPAASAANGSFAFQTLSFSNLNGISFGTSAGSAITASHNALTTARASNDAIGLNTAQTNVTWTVNSSGLSLNAAGYAGTGTSATNASVTLNSNGLAISVAAPGGAASQTIYATGNTTVNSSGTVALSSVLMRGYGIVSLGTSNGSILVSSPDSTSYNAYSVGFSTGGNTAGDTGFGTDRVVLAGGANITLSGSTNGGSATISIVGGAGGGGTAGTFYAQSNTTQSSSGTIALSSLNFAGAGIASVGVTNGSVVVSVPAGGGAGMSLGMSTQGNTAGTTGLVSNNYLMVGTGPISLSQSVNGQSATLSINAPATSSLSATGQLSISTNGSTISIGVGQTISGLVLAPFAGLGGPIPFAQSSISLGQNSLYLYPVQIEDYLTCDHFRMPVLVTNSSSAAASVQKGLTYLVGVYTRNSTDATVYSRHYSTSYTMAASHNSNASWALSMITAIGNSTSYNSVTASSAGLNLSASLHGPREFIMPVSSVFAPGGYMIGIVQSTSSVGAGGAVLNVSNMAVAYQTYNRPGVSTNATGSGFFKFMGAGTYSATTGALPAAISATQINQLGTLPMLFAATGTV